MFKYSSSIFHHGKIRIRPHYNSNTRANCITSASLSVNWNEKRKGLPEYKHAKAGEIINNCKMITDVFGAWMDSFPRKMRNVIAVGGDSFFFWKLWNIRKTSSFQRKLPTDLLIVFLSIYHWLNFWSLLQKTDT
jgi:hypothetical protein